MALPKVQKMEKVICQGVAVEMFVKYSFRRCVQRDDGASSDVLKPQLLMRLGAKGSAQSVFRCFPLRSAFSLDRQGWSAVV